MEQKKIDINFIKKNLNLQAWINFLSGFTFLLPVITLLYTYVGLSIPQIILIANVWSIVVFLFDLPTSIFADIVGRKKALFIAVLCNLLAAMTIVFFAHYWWFIVASIFGWLYFAFWNSTGQAFLEENLRYIGEEKTFGKAIGHLMSLETIAGVVVALAVSWIIKRLWQEHWYRVLAILDTIFAFIIVVITIKLKEIHPIQAKLLGIKKILLTSYITTKNTIRNILMNKNMRVFMIYRSLANHVAFLAIISLPLRVKAWMDPWLAGILWIISTMAIFIANKYAYKLWERWTYNRVWVFSTIAQAVLLIVVAFLLKSWIAITVIMVLFNFAEGLWMPAWNHVLMWQTKWIAVATTRSIIFTVFALYTTIGKQILARFPVEYALIGLGVFIILVNIVLWRKILKLKQ